MDALRFDAWTRRRVGLAAGGVIASLLAPLSPREGMARKKNEEKRCTRVGRRCRRIRDCCGSLACEPIDGVSGQRCCRQQFANCSREADCCGFLFCRPDGKCDLPDSDRALKTNFASVDPADILERLRALPISTWNYTADDPSVRHLGPMAQDFAALFAVGADDRHIHPLDGQGVSLAAIQGLLACIDALQAQNAQLAARVASLERPPDALQ